MREKPRGEGLEVALRWKRLKEADEGQWVSRGSVCVRDGTRSVCVCVSHTAGGFPIFVSFILVEKLGRFKPG